MHTLMYKKMSFCFISKQKHNCNVCFCACLDWSSALNYITEGDKEEHLDMLGGGVIKQLLDEKWKTFARVCLKLVLSFSFPNVK